MVKREDLPNGHPVKVLLDQRESALKAARVCDDAAKNAWASYTTQKALADSYRGTVDGIERAIEALLGGDGGEQVERRGDDDRADAAGGKPPAGSGEGSWHAGGDHGDGWTGRAGDGEQVRRAS